VRESRRGRDVTRGQRRAGRLLAAPALLVIVGTVVVPMIMATYLSFTSYDLLSAPRWVGLRNYARLFGDPVVAKATLNTLVFAGGQVAVGVVVAFFVAMLFNGPLVGGRLVRTAMYVPQAMSYVTVALLWSFLYDPAFGPINAWLRSAGFGTVHFLTDTSLAMPSIMAMSLWRNLGYYMIILLAGLKAIPPEQQEAAQIDGAGWWARLLHVTIPHMRGPLFFVAVTWFLGGLQMFTQAYVMTQGGPVHATRTVVYEMYESAFTALDIGRACAVAVLMCAAVLVVALPVRLAEIVKTRRETRAFA
jgi:multiple sugar transport system permease protein